MLFGFVSIVTRIDMIFDLCNQKDRFLILILFILLFNNNLHMSVTISLSTTINLMVFSSITAIPSYSSSRQFIQINTYSTLSWNISNLELYMGSRLFLLSLRLYCWWSFQKKLPSAAILIFMGCGSSSSGIWRQRVYAFIEMNSFLWCLTIWNLITKKFFFFWILIWRSLVFKDYVLDENWTFRLSIQKYID